MIVSEVIWFIIPMIILFLATSISVNIIKHTTILNQYQHHPIFMYPVQMHPIYMYPICMYPVQMHCSLDSGLVVVVFIISCLLWVVGLLLFYDFENVCDKAAARGNDSSSMVIFYFGFQLDLYIKDSISLIYFKSFVYLQLSNEFIPSSRT